MQLRVLLVALCSVPVLLAGCARSHEGHKKAQTEKPQDAGLLPTLEPTLALPNPVLVDAGQDATAVDAEAGPPDPILLLHRSTEGSGSVHATRAPTFDAPVVLSPTPEKELVTGLPLEYSPDDAKLVVAIYPAEPGDPYQIYVTFPCRSSDCAGRAPRAHRVASLARLPRIEFSPASNGLLLFDEHGTAWSNDDDAYYVAISNEGAGAAQLLAASVREVRFVGNGRAAVVYRNEGVTFLDLARFASGDPAAQIVFPAKAPAHARLGSVAPNGARFLVWSGGNGDPATLYDVNALLAGNHAGTPTLLTDSTSIVQAFNERVVVRRPDGYHACRWDGTAPVALGIDAAQKVGGCGSYLLTTTGAAGSAVGLAVMRESDIGAPTGFSTAPVVGVTTWNGSEFSELYLECLDDAHAILLSRYPSDDHFVDLSRALARRFSAGRYHPRQAFDFDFALVAHSPLYSGRTPVGFSAISSTSDDAVLWQRESRRFEGTYRWLHGAARVITNLPLQGDRLPGLFEIDATNPAAVSVRRLRDLVFSATLGPVSHDDRYVAYGASTASLPEVEPTPSGTYETERTTGTTRPAGPNLERPLRGVSGAVAIPGTRSLLLEGRFLSTEDSAMFLCDLNEPAQGCQRSFQAELAGRALHHSTTFVASEGVSAAAWYVDSAAGAQLATASFGSRGAQDVSLTLTALAAPLSFPYSTNASVGTVVAPDGSIVYAQGVHLYRFNPGSGVNVELDARAKPWPAATAQGLPPGAVYIPKVSPKGRIVFSRMQMPGTFVGVIEPDRLDVVHTIVETSADGYVSYDLVKGTEFVWYVNSEHGQPSLHVVDLAQGSDLVVDLSAAKKANEPVSVCGVTPDKQALLLNIDGSMLRVDLQAGAASGYRATLLYEGEAYCDDISHEAGSVTSALSLFVFRNPFASTVIRWDGSGPPVTLRLEGQDVRYARFSPDGRYLLARSEDDAHRWYRWSVSNLEAAPIALPGSDEAYTLVFDPSSRYVAIAKDDGVRVFELDHPDQVHTITGGAAQSVQWVP